MTIRDFIEVAAPLVRVWLYISGNCKMYETVHDIPNACRDYEIVRVDIMNGCFEIEAY